MHLPATYRPPPSPLTHPDPHPPNDRAEQQQVQEEDQRPVPTQVPVDERERQLDEQGGQQHEGDGEAQPDDIVGPAVHCAEHRGGDELRAVERRGQQHAEGGLDPAVIDHQHDSVPVQHGAVVLRVDVGDLPVLLLHGHLAHDPVVGLDRHADRRFGLGR